MTRWLLDEDHPLRAWPLKVLNWLAEGDTAWIRLLRLGLIVGVVFLFWFFVSGLGQDLGGKAWWLGPTWMSSLVVVPYGCWRLLEWRGRVKRRRDPPARTLDLS